MGAIGLRLRSEFRAGWRGWLLLALLLGIAGGASTAAAAGARRTQTPFPRFAASAKRSSPRRPSAPPCPGRVRC